MMKLKNLLVPTDFSDRSAAAVEYASNLAESLGAKLHIVHVDDLGDFAAMSAFEGLYTYDTPESTRRTLKAQLAKVKPTKSGIEVAHHFIQGVPSAQIVALADELPADLIVMSSHGRSGLSRVLMGSVAESVLRHANCPVLVVKQTEPTATDRKKKPAARRKAASKSKSPTRRKTR